MNYLKIGKATDLEGRDYKLYRILEILPGFLSWATLIILVVLSVLKPVWISYFIIAFDIYWLLLVLYLAIVLFASYRAMQQALKMDWCQRCEALNNNADCSAEDSLIRKGMKCEDVIHLVFLPTYNEDIEIIRTTVQSLVNDGFPREQMIVVLAMEERAGEAGQKRAQTVKEEFGRKFSHFYVATHPDNIPGELKGKGANQAWAAKEVKRELIDPLGLDYDRIVVSIFDIDTVVKPGYFHALTHKFLTVRDPYHTSYQPIPVYHNNFWQAPFFSRVAASSNTFWQMMMQIRKEQLVTYSSHSMTWKALVDIGFWSTNMVSEDSRIFFHCFMYYGGNYRVEPLYFPVSMDATMNKKVWQTAKSLYKQQRRWAWGIESTPYLMFNTIKNWKKIDRKKAIGHIFVQLYGFHSWATSALIIAVVGWLPLLLGGSSFNQTVLSGNLPAVTQLLMNVAMIGLVISAVMSMLLMPKRVQKKKRLGRLRVFLEWIFIPITIIFFGAIPCLEAQTRLMFKKYMGFWITPKAR